MTKFRISSLAALFTAFGILTAPAQTTTTAASANPDFAAVTAKLDQGGTFYLYANVESAIENAIGTVAPLMQRSGNTASVPVVARAVTRALGLQSINDIGVSVLPDSSDTRRMKMYLLLKTQEGLFKLRGKTPYDMQAVKYVPADALAASVENIAFTEVLPLIQQIAREVAGGVGEAGYQKWLEQARANGVDVEKIMASLGEEIAAYMRMDPEKKVTVNNASFSQPKYALIIQTKNSTLYDSMVAQAKKGKAPISELPEADGVRASEFAVGDNPLGFKPVIAQTPGWFIFATDAAELKVALSAASGGDIRTSADFKKLAADLPTQFNGLSFVSPKFGPEVAGAFKQMNQFSSGKGKEGILMLQRILHVRDDSAGRVTVRTNEDSGVLWTSQGDVGPAQILEIVTAAPITFPMLMVMRLPAAQGEGAILSKASRAKSDMRSMATGIESYFVDNNKYPPSDTEGRIRKQGPSEKPVSSYAGPHLTTPIAYITSHFPDPFAPDQKQTFGYYQKDDKGWILFSPGPDGKFNLGWEVYDPSQSQPSVELLTRYTYDPTNGVRSAGDIWRVKQ